ncbi:hypothetical protein LOTGIDRAFT_204677 [Lottia gigantea]|uniref:Uncharacterized protein n=1 Tax=Lottia gigantea TaxID=225164 RepID=V3ZKT2_LOTGI|nr:hypothetical protein LOTGIDRAFT_204677 [Lottia gigantea]ESO84867.1 hypothetical protein LOTGIDRAFT_204677 [Lottia gigantea]
MLHVTTEVGKPGKREREKRHYPHIQHTPDKTIFKPTGRRYIPHGHGPSGDWTRPHAQSVQVEYSKCGPDWESKLRYIPHPQREEYPAMEIWENNWKSMRAYPFTYRRSNTEWLLDPDHHRVGLRCYFNGSHKATMTSERELSHSMLFGKNRKDWAIDKRNQIPEASAGDKNYQVVEYSPNFHFEGSTRPIVQFGSQASSMKPLTFIPLQTLPPIDHNSFERKEKERVLKEDITTVEKLESWKPATPLHLTIPQEEPKKLAPS